MDAGGGHLVRLGDAAERHPGRVGRRATGTLVVGQVAGAVRRRRPRSMPVRVAPGLTQLTRTVGPSSTARLAVSPMSAALDAP